MSFVKENPKHKELEAELSVLEKEKGEMFEPYEIIYIEIENMRSYTPDEVIELGNWLIENAKRIKKCYTSTGKPRKSVSVGG